MEINQNPMPEIRLFPRVDRAIEFIGRVLRAGHVVEPCLTEHHKTGAAELLDTHMKAQDTQPELPFGDTIDRRKQPSGGRWTDMGCYYQSEEA